MKTCPACEVPKPLDDFHKSKDRKDGRVTWCKPCVALKTSAHYARNPGRKKEVTERYRNSPKYMAVRLKKYGLTPSDFELLKIIQGDACAICKEGFDATPHIDHNHETGKVRGLLCSQCNTALGLFNDSQPRLLSAWAYLKGTCE